MDCAGLGHALLKMWGRAVACFLTVGLLVFFGAGMREIFSLQVEMMRSTRWVIWQISVQILYFVAKSLETNGPDVSRADGDYGTRFLAAAGVLNLLAALHAYERGEDGKRERGDRPQPKSFASDDAIRPRDFR